MNIKWNANGYSKNFSFVHEYGQDVLKLLETHKGMTVIDLGCGNGAITNILAQEEINVIGIDSSQDMIYKARENYPHLHFIHADATEFTVDKPVDAIFSNAVFHWIDNQEKLLQNAAAALKTKGQLVCEFGGKGCAKTIHSSLEKSFKKRGFKYSTGFYFPTIGEYTPIMEEYGFIVTYAALFDRSTELKGQNGMEDWIRMFVQKPFESLPQDQIEEIIKEAALDTKGALFHGGKWYADYVRIRIKAIKQ